MPMATKLGGVVTYHEKLLPIKPHDTLITWSWKIRRQSKIIISPLPRSLPLPNLGDGGLLWGAGLRWGGLRGLANISTVTILKAMKLGRIVSDVERLLLVTWSSIIWKICISTLIRLMVTKLDRELTSGRRFSKEALKSSSNTCLSIVSVRCIIGTNVTRMWI